MGTTYSYNLNIPDAPNDPADDQPLMKENTNSLQTLLSVDHIPFNTDNGGIHKQVRMRNQSAPGLGDGQGALYTGSVNSNSWPHWQNSTDAFPLVSVSPVVPATVTPGLGVIPLAANMYMQFGILTTTSQGSGAGNANLVTMANAFPNNKIYNIQITSQPTTAGGGVSNQQSIQTAAVSAQTFNVWVGTNIPIGTLLYWMVIGS